jgi:glycosyltransferase involved in cell wall biosynthesis
MAVRRLQADVHHATHFNVPYATRAPIVLTVYDLILFLNPGMARSRAAGAYYRAMLPLAVRRANVVVAASPFTAGQLTETFGVERDKLRVIEVGLDHGRWNARPAAETLTVRAAYGLPSEFLLYVGTTKTHKNLSTLLAAHRSEHPPLVLVGPTSEELASLGVTAGASGRVIALGRVPDDALPAIYTSALALVCPSLAEGVGLPPLEAMACGTPTVVSNGGALPETVGDAGLVVPARDTEAWTAALSEITDNQALRDRLTSGGRAWVANRDWCRTARQYIDVYHDVASA